MPDWRGKDEDDDDMRDEYSDRRNRNKRGHGRAPRGSGDQPEFGEPQEFVPPAYAEDFSRTSGRGGGGGGYGGGRDGGSRDGGGSDFRPRPPAPAREAEPSQERGPRQSGTVKFFKGDKGFGFITPDNGDADVFVHISAVERSGLTSLDSDQRISFETEPDRRGKGPKAVELQLEEGASS